MYSDGTYCLPDSQLSVVQNSYPQILTKNVTFNWTASTPTQIVAYNITWVTTEDSSDSGEMVASPSGVQVQGLTPGTEYNFTVLSTLQGNDYYKDSVVPTHLTLETLPASPGKLRESSSNLHSLPYVLRFEPSEGRVARYNITVGGKSYNVSNPELTIKDLTTETQYNYTITAYNKHGVGSKEVAGIFKTDPESTFKQEKVSLKVTLIAGVTAAAVFVVIIAVAVVVMLVVRKRRENSKPPASETIEDIDDDEIVRDLPVAPTPSPRAVMNRYMTFAGLRANIDTDQFDGRENDYVTKSQIGAWHDVTYQNLQTTNNARYHDTPDVEDVYNNDVSLNQQGVENVYNNDGNLNEEDVENMYNNAAYVAS